MESSGCCWLVRLSQRGHWPGAGPTCAGLISGAGFALFGAAATILMGLGTMSLIFNGGDGAGASLSAGPVALVIALGFGALLLKWLREPRARILLG